ncbi:MAG: TetR/AcrR family transcriptional regulator [Desulfuromonadaceae bacterium]
MARPKAYIREQVIDTATRVFWSQGFKGTSVSDLVAKTGLNKHSLYQEFGSKEGLFRECLENFAHKMNREPVLILNREPLGLANIKTFFQNRIEYAASSSSFGCLLVNTLIEKELVDAAAFDKARGYLHKVEDCFYRCLEAARQSGELEAKQDCRVIARFLLNTLVGMMVLSKSGPAKDELEAMVAVALASLTG